ncbi:hypothetical protein [Pseudidiomarina aestuarii]|uniref:hypothetical protein n=1 Tax=Pseudidiomarina aestuarii TaxID=624146 RepID=UPI003A96D7C9
MRKFFIGAAVIGVAAVAGYQWLGTDSSIDSKLTTALSAVPSDTAVLSAYLEPIDMVAYMRQVGGLTPELLEQLQSDFTELMNSLSEHENSEQGADAESTANINRLKFLFAYANAMLEVISGDVSLEEQMGYAQNTRVLSYMVGIAPVIRWETADSARVVTFIESLENEYSVTPDILTVAGETVRSYAIDTGSEQQWSVWLSTNNDWTTLSVHSSATPTVDHALLIGAEAAPENVIADGSFDAIRERYALEYDSVGWMLSEVLTDALSDRQSNRLGRDLRTIFPEAFAEPELSQWTDAACQADLQTISERFPGFFSDMQVTSVDADNMRIDARMVLPVVHENTVGALQKLRGVVPNFMQRTLDDVTIAMALGIDASQLGPVASDLWNATAQADFSCAPLVELQVSMQQQPIGGAFAMTNMANGLLGLQVLVNDIDVNGLTQGDFSGQQVVVSTSLNDVASFYSVLQASFPPLAGVNLPAIGDTIDISPVMAMGIGVSISANMSRGEHQLTIATMDAVAQQYREQLNQTSIEERGLLAVSVDNGKISELIEAQFTAQGQPVPEELQSFMGQNTVSSLTLDLSLRGLEFVYSAETSN